MYYYLVSSLKRRLIKELQDSFSRHPIYSKIVPFIQNKYSFRERPQYGIVLKGSSSNKLALSGDNFMGLLQSHAMLAYVGPPKFPIEWVKEDLNVVRDGGLTAPGIYFIEIIEAPADPSSDGTFAVDRLLTASNRPVFFFDSGLEQEAQLDEIPVDGTLRLWLDAKILLVEGEDYRLGTEGSIRFLRRIAPHRFVTADYRYQGSTTGPHFFKWNTSDHSTIPGVILAFGKRAAAGDKVAVVVTQDRVDAAQVYGGKFEISFDMDVIARDPTQMEEIGDLAFMYLWNDKKPHLEFEGIEILDIGQGGESEELYDEEAQSFFYQMSLNVSMRADWEAHSPLPFTISQATTINTEGDPGVKQVGGSIFFQADPVLVRPDSDYERLG